MKLFPYNFQRMKLFLGIGRRTVEVVANNAAIEKSLKLILGKPDAELEPLQYLR